jgi:hypothetical protein
MILSEYIKLLQALPQDLEVFAERGEWGPVEVKLPVIETVEQFLDGSDWHVAYLPELTASDPDYKQKKVVVL